MSENLRPYRDYKETDIVWLGDIPKHWNLVPNRALFKIKKKLIGARSDDFDLLSLTLRGVIIRDLEKMQGKFPASFDTYQVVEPDDFVFCFFDVDETPRTVGLSDHKGMITGAYTVMESTDLVDRRYLYHYYLSLDEYKALKPIYRGLRKTIPKNSFLSTKTPLPPPDEQAAIVRFLDAAEKRIRRYIRAKQKLIKLLNEQKQAIIQQAVTRGLNPEVPMKDSGVEWLGEIPSHWKTIKLKFLVSVLGGMTPSKSEEIYWDGDIPWVSPKDMKVDVIKDSLDHITQIAVDETNISIVPSGSLLMVVRGMILARRVPVAVTACPVTINQDMKALVTKSGIRTNYLRLMFQGLSPVLLFFVEESGHGTRKFPTENWANLQLPIPDVDEQEEILENIQISTSELDLIIKKNEDQIDVIQEYRIRLIADVVTGKIDVRGLTFEMPDEFEDEGLLDVDEDDLLDEEDMDLESAE